MAEFQDRRQRLLNSIDKHAVDTKISFKNHLVVIPSSTKKYMSDKIPYVFRQNSDFFYLTGCLEPDSVLLLTIDENHSTKSLLFVRPKDKHAELWDGPRTGTENALEYFGVDETHDVSQFQSFIQQKKLELPPTNPVLLWYDESQSDQNLGSILSQLVAFPGQLQSPTRFIHNLRLIKSPAEIEMMRTTCRVASECINETMRETKPGDSEHHIFARVDYKCRMANATILAYPPVIASGNNATTIHYIANTQLTKPGDMILMDAGCEFGGYSSDITRTWPVSGEFNPHHRVLYEVVSTLQKDLIHALQKPKVGLSLDQLFETMCLLLGKYLQEVGLISKLLSGVSLAKEAYKFCPHHVSHYLGMDVHDTPLVSRSIKLMPGMICTVEPGIYISEDRTDVPKEFRGIGIRIEDDILIKENGEVENLTQACIKDKNELETLLRS